MNRLELDALSKYRIADMYFNKSAHTAANFILKQIIFKFAAPSIITPNLGKEFDEKVQTYIMEGPGIRRIRTTR